MQGGTDENDNVDLGQDNKALKRRVWFSKFQFNFINDFNNCQTTIYMVVLSENIMATYVYKDGLQTG